MCTCLQQPSKITAVEEKPEKKPPSAPSSTSGMTSALAGLFEARHPWAKEGGLEAGLGFNRYSSGGLLGIRSGMSKLPSFKVGDFLSHFYYILFFIY